LGSLGFSIVFFREHSAELPLTPVDMTSLTQSAPKPAHELVYEPNQLPKLRSNYGPHLDQSSVGWLRETAVETQLDEMRKRFDDDGYLYIKGLIPREDVLDVRQKYFEHLQPTGILKPGTSPRDGIFDSTQDPVMHNGVGGRDLPDDVERQRLLTTAHILPVYLEFLEHPDFRGFIRQFMGWKNDVILKRTLLR
jgi:phytanoyl-CoA hydroxylase